MSVLTRYMIRQNIFLLCAVLSAGVGIYLLADLIDRIGDFMEAGSGFWTTASYFGAKIPSIVSQILPAVFLISLVLQFNFLERNREITALEAGGISPAVLLRFVLVYGLCWAVLQFFFAQVAGVSGERYANTLWKQQIWGIDKDSLTVKKLWFTEKNYIVHIDSAVPGKRSGQGLLVYKLDPTGLKLEEILKADSFAIEDKRWVLHNATRLLPHQYTAEEAPEMNLPIRQDLRAFELYDKDGVIPAELAPWELNKIIRRLEKAGSNVEALSTARDAKYSYAASLAVMGLLALAVSRFTPNIYKAVGLSLLAVFIFYSINTFCTALGEKAVLPPLAAAWAADAAALAAALLPFLRHLLPQKNIRQNGLTLHSPPAG